MIRQLAASFLRQKALAWARKKNKG